MIGDSRMNTVTYRWHIIFFLLFSILSLPCMAEKIISPESIPGSKKVDAEGVIQLVNQIPELLVIDARITSDRKQGFIEGSVSLPDIDTNCNSLARIIPGKSAPVLFFCNGVRCGRSAKSVKIALDCGYNNVFWFRGGFEEWQAKGYPYLTE
jgi:rhodanese-related sulfurtransferase